MMLASNQIAHQPRSHLNRSRCKIIGFNPEFSEENQIAHQPRSQGFGGQNFLSCQQIHSFYPASPPYKLTQGASQICMHRDFSKSYPNVETRYIASLQI